MRGLTGQRRRAFATTACLLWLLGVEVLPAVHLAAHDHHHTHAADGSIVALGDGAEHAHAAHPDRAKPDPDFDFVGIDHDAHATPISVFDHELHGHAAGGLAHHAVALQQPAPPLLAPLPVTPPAIRVVVAPISDQVTSGFAARPTARGPPANA